MFALVSLYFLAIFASFASTANAGSSLPDRCLWAMTRPFVQAQAMPLDGKKWKGLEEPQAYAGLVTSQFTEGTVNWRLEGTWPEGLHGRALRVGPFGFDSRSGQRKVSLLDSAGGMIREFVLDPNHPRFSNRHIQTPAYLAEQKAGKFLFPSIETLAPGNWNGLARTKNQATVAVYVRGDKYWATDELRRPVPIAGVDLSTGPEVILNPEDPNANYLAHGKIDPTTGNLCFMSVQMGPNAKVHVVCVNAQGQMAWRSPTFTLPSLAKNQTPYFHDWALTENQIVVFLHPQFISLPGLLRAAVGVAPLFSGLTVNPTLSSRIVLFARDGHATVTADLGEAVQAWHFINAYEAQGEFILDMAGTTVTENQTGVSPLRLAMLGLPIPEASPEVFLRRYRVDQATGRLLENSITARDANYEFPTIPEALQGRRARFAYVARATHPTPWHDGVAKVDLENKTLEVYSFPPHQFVGEPLFAPRGTEPVSEDDGYVLVDVYDSQTKTNHLAIFSARDMARGPIARLWLPFHLPIGFHGVWSP